MTVQTTMVHFASVIRFIPTSLGDNTAGSFEWYFDGSDVGLTTNNEDIDTVGFAPDGRLVISAVGSFGVTVFPGTMKTLSPLHLLPWAQPPAGPGRCTLTVRMLG